MDNIQDILQETKNHSNAPIEDPIDVKNTSGNSNESEPENLEAIKKFIQDQETQESEKRQEEEPPVKESTEIEDSNKDVLESESGNIVICHTETSAVASSVMDMILNETESKIEDKKGENMKANAKQGLSLNDKGTMALSVGSKVEAKDFAEYWYPAQIVEVDYDEMEVLVHYENASNKHDEWISVSSPRLRPLTTTMKPELEPQQVSEPAPVKEEPKTEDKPKLSFVVGERCLARWRDSRRFMATVHSNLGEGNYEVIFDDGVHWKCNVTRMYKLKRSDKSDLYIDIPLSTPPSTPSPILTGSGPSDSPTAPVTPNQAFHTHLFDPTRDYLGSKSERREMKRKLNIKEIFNIGQKQRKKPLTPQEPKVKREKNPRVKKEKENIKTEVKVEVEDNFDVKADIPDAVASIIGHAAKDENEVKKEVKKEIETEIVDSTKPGTTESQIEKPITPQPETQIISTPGTETQALETGEESKADEGVDSDMITLEDLIDQPQIAPPAEDPPSEISDVSEPKSDTATEETLENFDKPDDVEHGQVMEKIKEVITKLEDGLLKVDTSTESEVKVSDSTPDVAPKDKTKKLSKIKKSKKLRLLQEKKVKKQVEKVKSELEAMKRQVEEMRQQMMMKTEALAQAKAMPASFLLPGEWCCKWVNGQPVGTVSEIEAEPKSDMKAGLPRRSVQVEDARLPPGWTKHMVRRSWGNSAGKWDVVIISPENRRFHTKTDMRPYIDTKSDLKPYEQALLDFGVHLKLARRMGWVTQTDEGPSMPTPGAVVDSTSPLKRRTLKRKEKTEKLDKRKIKRIKVSRKSSREFEIVTSNTAQPVPDATVPEITRQALEDGFVHVGALKVQILENLLRCPAEGCFKNFRNTTLLQMHIKHYHRELRKMMGVTPKVLDLAYARTRPGLAPVKKNGKKVIKVKLPKPKRVEERKEANVPDIEVPLSPIPEERPKIPRSQDSPKLRQALGIKPKKRPRVLLPVRKPDLEPDVEVDTSFNPEFELEPVMDEILIPLDFETAISTHTVTRPLDVKKKDKKKSTSKKNSEDDEWLTMNSDYETRSSFPGSGTPDSKEQKSVTQQPVSSESMEEKDKDMYMYTETGELIKLERMKREEIINCHCGFREEDGLMVQCELCLCWQHALCHNIHREAEVPAKYTCSICLNPRRGRRSQRFLHDQDRLYEGLLPGAEPCETLRRSHELTGNLVMIQDALHAMRVKYYVATKKDHPKLYLWAKEWDDSKKPNGHQDTHSADYTDLNIIINNIGKENLPIETRDAPEDDERRDQTLMSLAAALSSPGGTSLPDIPISTSELEKLAKSVQACAEQESQRVSAPQPEAAIENGACRERLLRHVQCCQTIIDERLDTIEALVAELESQDPSFEDDETADYFPRTKQTIQMLMHDLDTMEELGIIT